MRESIQMMTTDQVRGYMESHKPDDYLLLDVRQAWEYEDFHIPGARLVPLVELADRLDEVDRGGPTVIYCASGGRSMAAATLLEGQGYEHLINMVGGMSAWQGHRAFGPMTLGLIKFVGREQPVEVILKAYAMENNLQKFYLQRADMAETMERIELFMELASFEDKHKDTLYELYTRVVESDIPRDMFEEVAFGSGGTVVEGGVDIQEFLDKHAEAFDGEQGILQLAVMVEAQALDYYLRCAMLAEDSGAMKLLQLLAREEKAHLKLLGKHMDKRES